MTRVMLITFAVLGWAWFELSGGTDFVPGENGVDLLAAAPEPRTVAPAKRTSHTLTQPEAPVAPVVAEVVTRDGTQDLAKVSVVALQTTPAPTPIVPAASVTNVFAPTPTETAIQEQLAALSTPTVLSDAVTVTETLTIERAQIDYRTVTGTRVNLRQGPSTNYDVVTQLLRGEEVEVLDATGDGWVKLRALDGSDIGWMSDSFLTASN